VPLDLHDIGVDYYAVPGQKWLCGPEGIGALYVRRDEQERLSPTYTGFFALPTKKHPHLWDCFGHMELAPDARRYESSSIYLPGMHGMLASLQWLEDEVGWDWALARTASLSRYTRQTLSALPMLKVFTPQAAAGLLHFTVPEGADVEQVNDALVQRGIRIRTIPHMNCLRVSTGFWNTENEIDKLADALAELLA
jgi:L-cysteine/cystine lyase